MEDIITYEQPLNESIRICLRLEHLLAQLEMHRIQSLPADSHLAMVALLKTLNVVDRPDLKSKLTQTLTQQATTLAPLEHAPQVDKLKLQQLLRQLDTLIDGLHRTHGKTGENLRQNPFLNQIRLHLHNPSGPSHFNTPAYSLWLRQQAEKRIHDLQQWANEFQSLHTITKTILRITRDSATTQASTATQGLYQQTLDANLPCQLIQIKMPMAPQLYPEFSLGKHRIVIRFIPLDPHRDTPIGPIGKDVAFMLSYCRI